MRLVCPTAFKGSFNPLEAARRLAGPGDRILPLSDGGDGFLACLHHALGGPGRRPRPPIPSAGAAPSRCCAFPTAPWPSNAPR